MDVALTVFGVPVELPVLAPGWAATEARAACFEAAGSTKFPISRATVVAARRRCQIW